MNTIAVAARICVAVSENEDIPNPTARIAAWIVGVALRSGGFPIEVSVHEMQRGFPLGSHAVAGTGCHHNTIKAALEWLQDHELLQVAQGAYLSGGKYKHIISVK